MAAEMIPTIPPDHKNKEINKEQKIFVESVLWNWEKKEPHKSEKRKDKGNWKEKRGKKRSMR